MKRKTTSDRVELTLH